MGSIAFPFAHIAGPDYLVSMLVNGFRAGRARRRFVPAAAVEIFCRHGVTVAGGSTAFYQAFLTEQRKAPATPIMPTLRVLRAVAPPSRRRSSTRSAASSA